MRARGAGQRAARMGLAVWCRRATGALADLLHAGGEQDSGCVPGGQPGEVTSTRTRGGHGAVTLGASGLVRAEFGSDGLWLALGARLEIKTLAIQLSSHIRSLFAFLTTALAAHPLPPFPFLSAAAIQPGRS